MRHVSNVTLIAQRPAWGGIVFYMRGRGLCLLFGLHTGIGDWGVFSVALMFRLRVCVSDTILYVVM